jgi:hypothetical protein
MQNTQTQTQAKILADQLDNETARIKIKLLEKIDKHLDSNETFTATDFYNLVQVLSNIESRRSLAEECMSLASFFEHTNKKEAKGGTGLGGLS